MKKDSPLRNIILNMLSDTEPMSESAIARERGVGILRKYSEDSVKAELDFLLSKNKIRWVAFRGYCKGGRPS